MSKFYCVGCPFPGGGNSSDKRQGSPISLSSAAFERRGHLRDLRRIAVDIQRVGKTMATWSPSPIRSFGPSEPPPIAFLLRSAAAATELWSAAGPPDHLSNSSICREVAQWLKKNGQAAEISDATILRAVGRK
jgi:hypothetical protein